ncbi:MAG: hypothetical protein JXA93_17755 [Anaerolineae bacterium]|nr:hypothetical protein [Anaerolineae bacterium]
MKLSVKAQAALDQVVEQFKSGDLSPVVKIARIQRQGDGIPSDKWSLGNKVLIYIQTGTLDCRGFRQWQEAGRKVSKGARAAFILAPIMVPIKDADTGEARPVLKGFRSVAVFADHQTEGDPLPEVDYTPVELPPLADVARSLGVELTYQPLPSDRLGACDVTGRRIKLGSHDPGVFFHELAHAAHARIEGKLRGGQDPRQETVAEFTAAVLMHLYGLGDRAGNCWQYVKQYAADPLQAILTALGTVEKVLDLLLDETHTQSRAAVLAEAPCGYGNGTYAQSDENIRAFVCMDDTPDLHAQDQFPCGNTNTQPKEAKMQTRLTQQMMGALAEPFPPEAIQWKPGATNKDKTRGLALAYVDLRHYIDRLNEVAGGDWSDDYEVQEGGKVVVCRLTIAGVTRSDVGEAPANDENTATTALAQAFKRACVKFGLGAFLYRLPRTWVEYDVQRKCFTKGALAQLYRAVAGNAARVEPVEPDDPVAGDEPHAPEPAPVVAGNGNGSVGPTEFWTAVRERGIDKAAAEQIAKGAGSWAEKLAALRN